MSENKSSISELMKQFFADKDNNGIPDIFEHKLENGQSFSMQSSTNKIVVNGKEYAGMDEVPADEKEKIMELLKKFPHSNSAVFTDLTKNKATSVSTKPKESKIIFPDTANENKRRPILNAKTLNIILIVLLIIAAWLIWGKKMS